VIVFVAPRVDEVAHGANTNFGTRSGHSDDAGARRPPEVVAQFAVWKENLGSDD
jgi:hypothetical protein